MTETHFGGRRRADNRHMLHIVSQMSSWVRCSLERTGRPAGGRARGGVRRGVKGCHGGLLFYKAVEIQLAQALVCSLKPLDKVCNVLPIVLQLVSFLGLTEDCALVD